MKRKIKRLMPLLIAAAITAATPFMDHDNCGGCSAPVIFFSSIFGCSDMASRAEAAQPSSGTEKNHEIRSAPDHDQKIAPGPPVVTFIELGSENCMPCRMMKPVLERVKREHSASVKVVYYDVWTPEGKPYAARYGIRAIPTQVFLDRNEKEFYRHTGFLPYDEVVKVLKRGGVK